MVALSLVERIVQWVEPAFNTAGYLIIAVAVLAERSIFVGLVVPGDVILALGGVFSSQGKLNLVLVIVIGSVSAICGESIGYAIGRRYGRGFIRRIPFVGRWLHRLIEESEEHFQRRGSGITVALGRYATAAGAFIPFTAGAGRMPYRRFIMWDAPAIVIWATGIAVFGYFFGNHLPFVDKVLSRFGFAALGLLVVFFAGRYLWKRWRGHRERR
jgi:membrane protein DedA with SNARE-associated domain